MPWGPECVPAPSWGAWPFSRRIIVQREALHSQRAGCHLPVAPQPGSQQSLGVKFGSSGRWMPPPSSSSLIGDPTFLRGKSRHASLGEGKLWKPGGLILALHILWTLKPRFFFYSYYFCHMIQKNVLNPFCVVQYNKPPQGRARCDHSRTRSAPGNSSAAPKATHSPDFCGFVSLMFSIVL